ncbi:hypothetical protein [Frigoribacterium sp. CG_9.8]|uniref:hypothetical protein n=1 Tax=Frigoribacterium sp. CG_9.8 TaxID=2787733 RepID=UPI0018C8E9E0|nr:hypothetical protein [Frigoribacterium sp. CG_9.8]MBG6106590.1 hypothetical protein [Frigoribacterium sp. CG_9.8]
MTIHITKDQAIEFLNQAVAAKGADFKYKTGYKSGTDPDARGCHYVRDGAVSCIVGHALSYAGVPVAFLDKMDDQERWPREGEDDDSDYPQVTGTGIGQIAQFLTEEVTMDADALDMLVRVQRWQDVGESWGSSVTDAIRIGKGA